MQQSSPERPKETYRTVTARRIAALLPLIGVRDDARVRTKPLSLHGGAPTADHGVS